MPKKTSNTASKAKKATAKPASAARGATKSISKTQRAGLIYPVGRFGRHMRKDRRHATRQSNDAPVFMAGAVQAFMGVLLRNSHKVTEESKRKRINAHHIKIAMVGDPDYREHLKHADIANGGVVHSIHSALLVKPRRKPARAAVKKEVVA